MTISMGMTAQPAALSAASSSRPGTWMRRGRESGTLMRAKCSLPLRGLRRMTARLRDRPEM